VKADHVVIVALGGTKVSSQFHREVDRPVPRVFIVPHIGEVDQHLPVVSKIDAGAIRVPQQMTMQDQVNATPTHAGF